MNQYPHPQMTREEVLDFGLSAIRTFCDLNGYAPPAVVTDSKGRDARAFGYYRRGTQSVYVNLKRSKLPVKTPGFSWSYTGYKADLTAAGIAAHEFGHYIDYRLGQPSGELPLWVGTEPGVSSYEPTPSEAFAEAMKLMVLNPDLLRVGRPKRWRFLTERLGMRPATEATWEEVLSNAHPKLISAARNWAALGHR